MRSPRALPSLSPIVQRQRRGPGPCVCSLTNAVVWLPHAYAAERVTRTRRDERVYTPNTDSREADAMRELTFGMNLSLDGYIAAAPATTSGEACRATSCSSRLTQQSNRVSNIGRIAHKRWKGVRNHSPRAAGPSPSSDTSSGHLLRD
jgi:hypothetical protein